MTTTLKKKDRITKATPKEKFFSGKANIFGSAKSAGNVAPPSKEELKDWRPELKIYDKNGKYTIYAIPESLYNGTRTKQDNEKRFAKISALEALADFFDGKKLYNSAEYYQALANTDISLSMVSNFPENLSPEEIEMREIAFLNRMKFMGLSKEELEETYITRACYPDLLGTFKTNGYERFYVVEVNNESHEAIRSKLVYNPGNNNIRRFYRKNVKLGEIDYEEMSNSLIRANTYLNSNVPKVSELVDTFGFILDIDGVDKDYIRNWVFTLTNGFVSIPSIIGNSGNGLHVTIRLKSPISTGKSLFGVSKDEWKKPGTIYNLANCVLFLLYAIFTMPGIFKDPKEPTKFLNILQGVKSIDGRTKSGDVITCVDLNQSYSIDELLDSIFATFKRIYRVYLECLKSGKSFFDLFFEMGYIEEDYIPFKSPEEFLKVYNTLIKNGIIDKAFKRREDYPIEMLVKEESRRKLRFNTMQFLLDDYNNIPDSERNYDIPENVYNSKKLYEERKKAFGKKKKKKNNKGYAHHDKVRYISLLSRVKKELESGNNLEGNRKNICRDLFKVGKKCGYELEEIFCDLIELLPLFNKGARGIFTEEDIMSASKGWNNKGFTKCADRYINEHLGAEEGNEWYGPNNKKRKAKNPNPRRRGKGRKRRMDAVKNDKKIYSAILKATSLSELIKIVGLHKTTVFLRIKNEAEFQRLHRELLAEKILKEISKNKKYRFLKAEEKIEFVKNEIREKAGSLALNESYVKYLLLEILFLVSKQAETFKNSRNRNTPEKGFLFSVLKNNGGNPLDFNEVLPLWFDNVFEKYFVQKEEQKELQKIQEKIKEMHLNSAVIFGIDKEIENFKANDKNLNEIFKIASKALIISTIERETRKLIREVREDFDFIKPLIVSQERLNLISFTARQKAIRGEAMYSCDSLFGRETWDEIKESYFV